MNLMLYKFYKIINFTYICKKLILIYRIMHIWGDGWFEENGKTFDDAIYYFFMFAKKYGRIKFTNKEKYGTHRTEFVTFWGGGLHYLVSKKLYHIDYPRIHKIDPFIKFFTKWLGIKWIFRQYQYFIWNLGVQKVCKKYPNIIDEFVVDMDYYKLIKPSIFGKVDGTKIHNKYWK